MKREKAVELLKKYNKEEFHIRHALTVEAVMRYLLNKKDMTRILGNSSVYCMM